MNITQVYVKRDTLGGTNQSLDLLFHLPGGLTEKHTTRMGVNFQYNLTPKLLSSCFH
jgi:hypothetical protein